MAGRKAHRRMSGDEQARLSQSHYAQSSRSTSYNSARSTSRDDSRRASGRANSRNSGLATAGSRSDGVAVYTQRRNKKKRGFALRVTLITLLVVLVGAGTAFAFYLNNINSRLTSGLSDDDSSALREQLVDVSPQEPFYMLLLGVDKSEERVNGEYGSSDSAYRSDTIILARIDPPSQKVTLVSIPRDTQVEMGSHGTQKINAAYSYGGPAYITQVVSELAGVEISHYAEVDFEELTSIVDTIGGIEVTLPVAVSDPDYAEIELPAGTQTINGTQALGLCRSRHAYDNYGGGDFYRAANQRMIIAAIVKKILSLDILTMTNTVSDLASSITIDENWSVTDILGLAMQFRDFDTDNNIYSGQLPTVSSYENSLWYEKVDTESWNTMMERVKAGESPYASEDEDFTHGIAGTTGNGVYTNGDETTASSSSDSTEYSGSVLVLNGTGTSGLAANKANTLTSAGFSATADNADTTSNTTTKVYYNGSAQAKANGVAEKLGVSTSNVAENTDYSTKYDVIVVLGSDVA